MFPKIKIFQKDPTKNTPHHYLSVVISLASVEAAVWEMITDSGAGYNIIGHARKDLENQDEVVAKVTEVIDEAGSSAGVDFEDAVFGLPNSWIEKKEEKDGDKDEEIIASREHLIDKLCKDLEIEPIAFVPIDSAVSYFLAPKLGGPLTANLIEIGSSKISVSVLHSGTVKYSQELKKSADIAQSVFNLFANSKSENLPAKFIIFGATSEDELAQIENEFNNFNWLQKEDDYTAFLHIPKVTAVTDFSLAEAVAMSTASDFATQDEFMQASKDMDKTTTGEIINASPLPDEPQVVTPFPEEEPEENKFGFVQGEDIAASGAVLNEKPEPTAQPPSEFPEVPETALAQTGLPQAHPPKSRRKRVSFNVLAPLLNLRLIKKHRAVFYSVVASLGLIAVIVLYLIVPRAEINIKVKTQNFDQRFVITASTSTSSPDASSRTIPAKAVSVEESGGEKTVATGSKTVGERAKGTVTVYNKTDSLRVVPKGSVMTTGGLSFTLDNDVSIASQSAGIEGSTYGKTDAAVTASAVGTDSNIASDKDLKFSNFDINLLSARSKGAFSGGSSRQITVFSQDDATRVKNLISEKILDAAVAKIQAQNPSTQILKSAVTSKIISEKYEQAVGDEATSVGYEQKASFNSIIYSTDDINNISYDLILKSIPQGYDIRKEDIKIDPVVKSASGGKLEIELNLSTKVFAKIDTNDIAKQIKGKSVKAVDDYFKSFSNISSYEFNIIPPMPDFIKTAPTNPAQIKINILPE